MPGLFRFFDRCAIRVQLFLLFSSLSFSAGAASLALSVADISASDFSASGIALTLPQDGSAELRIEKLHVLRRELRKVILRCARFELSTAAMNCSGGSLDKLPGTVIEFDYRFGGAWRFSAQLHSTSGKALAVLLPADMPRLTQGTLHGSVQAGGDAAGAQDVRVDLRLADIGFSDAGGLHAAEKLRGTLKLAAARKASRWNWQGELVWQAGELFWQPLYLGGAVERKLSAAGSYDGTNLVVEQAEAASPPIGKMRFTAYWDVKQGRLAEATVRGDDLALERLFADYAKPFFDGGALAEATLSGHADVDWRYRDGATQSLRLALRDAGINDAQQRFALRGLNTVFDWRPDAAAQHVDIVFDGGEMFGVPFGSAQWRMQMQGMEFGVAQAALPLLDGKLELSDFSLRRHGDDWRWQFGAALSGISMERFSQALGWPKMLGTLAGRIPRVSYDGTEIATEGALLFKLFDGTVVASRLRLADPFGRAPRLYGNLNMRDLDLDLLTRTFSFGSMQGRIDVDVNDLELQSWQPARFDARIASSVGEYPKKISQKAVQNISALGGAGAAAAIQRSYLRFFENFGYDRIGWRCKLRNGVCAMGGVDNGSGGAYAIVKGGGIPAITVMGYNRAVSWDELVSRLKRVTQGNMQAVVK